MDAAWKQFLTFTERHDEDDLNEHRQCLDALKAGIREALRTSLHPKKNPVNMEDANASLLLIGRTLHGQTCCFGNHIFNFRQACIVLLNLLKLLPEPAFEPVAPALASMAAQLVEQLGRQDFSLLHSFMSDCVGALMNARERPFTTLAFPKFVQRCKVAISEESPASAKAGMPGLPLELSTTLRVSTFCARLSDLTLLVVRAIAPFTSLLDLDSLWEVMLGLASDAASWAEQVCFDASESARIAAACVRGLHGLLLDGLGLECLQAASLHVQSRVLDELPRIAAFVLRECEDAVGRLLVEMACRVVSSFDDAILHPRLRDVLRPFWPGGRSLSASLRVFLAAAERFGGVSAPAEELWQCLTAESPSPGLGLEPLPAAGLEPGAHALLAEVLHELRAHVALCTDAVGRARAPPALLALAVRALPRQGAPEPACGMALARFAEEARGLLRQQLPAEPQAHVRTLTIVLETLRSGPARGSRLEGAGEAFLAQLLQFLLTGKAPACSWRLFLLALQVFVVQSEAPLVARFGLLQKLLVRPSGGGGVKRPHFVEAAAWVALGHMLLRHIRGRTDPGQPAKSHEDNELVVYKKLMELVVLTLSHSSAPHKAVLAAIAFLFPLLVTFSHLVQGIYERGAGQTPHIPEVFSAAVPYACPDVLGRMHSPSRSAANPLKAVPAFKHSPAGQSDHGAQSPDAERVHVRLPAPCPFCDALPQRTVASGDSAPGSECQRTDASCTKCGMEMLSLDWCGAFGKERLGCSLGLPSSWGRFRSGVTDLAATVSSDKADMRWLRNLRQLLEIHASLCGFLLGKSVENGKAGDPPDASRSAAADVLWLLRCGLFGLCVSASSSQLKEHRQTLTELFRRLLAECKPCAAEWESLSSPNVLLALLKSNSFVATLLDSGAGGTGQRGPPAQEPPLDEAQPLQVALQRKCHVWRLEMLGVSGVSPWRELSEAAASEAPEGEEDSAPLEPTAPRPAVLPPTAFSAVFAGAPRAAMSSALASLVAGAAAPRMRGSAAADTASPSLCLQHLLASCMLAPVSLEDLFDTLQGNMYLRLFERYSRRNLRVESLCQYFLRGPLKAQVRSLLPKILPAMVLTKRMQTIQDLCALLEESVQSLFTPQLPYILSAIAQQPVQNVAGSFMFILQRVYSNQMTITNICDASLGKVLVLILWSSAGAEDGREARSRALSAVDNIVSALRAHQPGAATPPRPQDPQRKRGAGGAGTAGAPPRKRRPGRGGEAAPAGDDPLSADVVQTLEGSFLHVLDILEIVVTGNRQSPKWAEYSSLLQDSHGGGSLDHARMLAAIAVLFELVPESLHRFAPKILEFLQSATALPDHQEQSIRCWQHFVHFVGVPRLKPLVPAVVGELLRIADQLKQQAPARCRQLCEGLLSSVVEATCKQHPDSVAFLPSLPSWPELKLAKASVDRTLGPRKDSAFAEHLEVGVAKLESATQQAVKRAALDHIGDLITSQRSVLPSGITDLNTQSLARLVRALLKFLWESSAWPNDQLKCGQLLGAIGAVDPSRFAHMDLGQGHSERAPQNLGNMEFLAKRVLSEFLVPNLTSKNSYAFAVQEILKYLQKGGKADKILRDLQEDVRETLRPYLQSSYQLIEPAQLLGNTSTFEGVVAQAVALVQGEQRALFEACLPAVHGNHALALFLMHHVVHHLLTSSTALGDLGRLALSLAGLLESPKHATAQAVFSLVDDIIHRREQLQLDQPAVSRPGDATAKNKQLQRIEQIRKPITNRKIVTASVRCGAHARALQFLEDAIIEELQGDCVNPFDNPRIKSEEDCFLLQAIYRDLDEPDGVLGALRIGPATARTRTLQLEQAGRWQDVQACYEEQLSSMTSSGAPGCKSAERQDLLCGLVRCTQNMRRFESSLRLIQGMEEEGMQARLKPSAVEAAWQLSSWDRLQQALDMPSASEGSEPFEVKLGQSLLAFHNRDVGGLKSVLEETTLHITRTLASAARESYTRAYQHLLKLHVLSDIAWLSGRLDTKSAQQSTLAENLLSRSEATAPTFPTRQLILGPLKVALTDMRLVDSAKRVELAFIGLCRKHNVPIVMEHPSIGFRQASQELQVRAQLEWGRLLYARGSQHDALQHMQQLAPQHPRARLLGTRWATEASSELLIPKVAEAEFKEARERLQEDEAAWFYHASYLDRLLKEQLLGRSASASSGPARALRRNQSGASVCPFDLRNLVTFTLRGYLQALHRGNKRLHFILNRVLQLAWDCCELDLHKKDALAEIDRQSKTMEPWMWYVVLPQLISRVHNTDMRQVFTRLIMDVVIAYPHQACWQMVQLLKSSVKEHHKLGKEMLLDVARTNYEIHRTMTVVHNVCEDLNTLATFTPPDTAPTMNLAQHFPKLVGKSPRSTEKWNVLVPLQSQMTAAIPLVRHKTKIAFNPFPEQVCTERCLEVVDVFRTKERPKKLTFRGTDGKTYPFLCKAERRGDLRKDSRMMQFGAMVNQLLQKNPDARRRNLEVQTFNVVIFAESCGLIEWVSNTRGMRHVIDDLWKRLRPGHQQSVREIKDLFDHSKDLYETFTKQVLPRHPPVLHRWFATNADPSVWLSKRLSYTRSQALWSMLGYITGLGDRHGENILLDTESGRVVHVDFDCLFGKGMMLERPETVPFRLTQNCVAAMGVTGIEGVFRKSCELCMDVLRDRANQQTLLSVLHVFIADPLIEWTSRAQRDRPDEDHGIQHARNTIGDVEKKLNGMLNVGAVVRLKASGDGESVLSSEERGKGLLGRDRGVGLSVAGQVDELLKAAMCKRNLSEMYVGWQPWL